MCIMLVVPLLDRLLIAPQNYTISVEYRQDGIAFFVVLPIIYEPLVSLCMSSGSAPIAQLGFHVTLLATSWG